MSKLRRHKQRTLQVAPRFLAKVTGIPEDNPGACVTYSKLLAQALSCLGYEATVVPVQYIIGNEKYKIGAGLNDEGKSDDEYFHAVVHLVDRQEFIDLTISQATRRQYGWVCAPFWCRIDRLPPYILGWGIVEDFEPPSRLYDSMRNPEELAQALALVIDGHDVEVIHEGGGK